MAANNTPQSYLYNQRPVNMSPQNRSAQQYYTNSGNPYGYPSNNTMPYFQNQGYAQQGAGYIPQNYGNVSQPNNYDPSYQPAVQNRYIPPTFDQYQNQWNTMSSYNLPAGYGPYNNNGYQIPYFNQGQGSQNGNPYAQQGYYGQQGLGGGQISPAYQMQQQSPYMPQFNRGMNNQRNTQQYNDPWGFGLQLPVGGGNNTSPAAQPYFTNNSYSINDRNMSPGRGQPSGFANAGTPLPQPPPVAAASAGGTGLGPQGLGGIGRQQDVAQPYLPYMPDSYIF